MLFRCPDPLVLCGRKADACKNKVCGFKNIQTFHNMEIKTDHGEERFQDYISLLKKIFNYW